MRVRRRALWLGALLVALVAALPAGGAGPKQKKLLGTEQLAHFSQGVVTRYWAENPGSAPKQLSKRLAAIRAEAGEAARRSGGRAAADVFNSDIFGLPQNEESVAVCQAQPGVVLMGTNDYRGLLDPAGNFTGWHFSSDGGRSLANEGLLPSVSLLSEARQVPSGGDPVEAPGTGCTQLYAASLAYNPEDPFGDKNGIAVYRSTPGLLGSCDTATDPANPDCWPVRRLVVESAPSHFLDKEWFDVGQSGGAGEVVWVTYSDFTIDFQAPLGFTAAEIFAVRCDAALVGCTSPIPISVDDGDVQFSDVTVGPDGRVYVTWAEIVGELPTDPEFPVQTWVIKMRVTEPGSTTFGPERIVAEEELPIPFGGFLHSNDFRVATYPKNEIVATAAGTRSFLVWDACRHRPLDFICEESEIKLTFSDDRGASWSDPVVISQSGDNYFPTIAWNGDVGRSRLALAWYTTRFDEPFHNAQDVEYVSLDPASLRGRPAERLTNPSNQPEADPALGGFFIGDYIEVAAAGGQAFVGFNANYRKAEFLGPVLGPGSGVPVAQQDNYLVTRPLP